MSTITKVIGSGEGERMRDLLGIRLNIGGNMAAPFIQRIAVGGVVQQDHNIQLEVLRTWDQIKDAPEVVAFVSFCEQMLVADNPNE